MKSNKKKNNTLIYNLIFLFVCGGGFLFLWNAPPESTAFLPHDEDHKKFYSMGKKEAEKFCTDCHNKDGVYPLPEDHPPKYRCLFCHKKK